MARPKKHVERVLQKNRLSKKVKEEKTTVTLKIGDSNFPIPTSIKNNVIAKSKWLEIVKLLSKTECGFSSGDSGALERLCVLYSYESEIRGMINEAADIKELANIHRLHNSKCGEIRQLESLFFLNPKSKQILPISATAKPAEKTELEKMGFGDV